MLLLIQRLTQRPKKPSETVKEVVGIKLQSPQIQVPLNKGGGGQRGLETSEEQTRDPRMQPTKSKRKAKVKWQATSNKVEWKRSNNDVDTILTHHRLTRLDKIIEGMYRVGLDRFGKEEKLQSGGGVIKKRGER